MNSFIFKSVKLTTAHPVHVSFRNKKKMYVGFACFFFFFCEPGPQHVEGLEEKIKGCFETVMLTKAPDNYRDGPFWAEQVFFFFFRTCSCSLASLWTQQENEKREIF